MSGPVNFEAIKTVGKPLDGIIDELLHLGERVQAADVDGLEPVLYPPLAPGCHDKVQQDRTVFASVEGNAHLPGTGVARQALLNHLEQRGAKKKKANKIKRNSALGKHTSCSC